ncbi:hypothetical protein J5N97_012892 [Dioscorea zingiberensis]|uniref:Lachrymatory factor synthase n=1 Tax=Dioscorea zingiberensis TaxID=325984 RepID=A0A9D5HI99_9LILI|nr:hypothetical protein J5N97_012892 [Dioscorea zingiberensis]
MDHKIHNQEDEEKQDQDEHMEKWQGCVVAKLRQATANKVWPLVGDFLSLNKWMPNIIAVCELVDGVPGQAGCLRYCTSAPATDITGASSVFWAKERLLSSDPSGHSLSYEITENNMGFTRYVATLKVVAGFGDDDEGCSLEWSFESDPVEGWTQESFVSYLQNGLDAMAANVEEVLHDLHA